MIRSRLLLLFCVLTLGFSAGLPLSARAENPLEKLHKKLFGEEERKREDDKKKKKDKDKDKDHDKDRERERDERRREEERRYQDRRYERPEPVVVERRVYVEPAPRPTYERRYEREEPAPRYSDVRPIEVDVQLALRREGYYRGPIDGELGPGTRSSIRDYQYDRQLQPSGRIDTSLLRSLGL